MIKVATCESSKCYKDVKSVVKDYEMVLDIMHNEGVVDLNPSQIEQLYELEEAFEQIEDYLGYTVSVNQLEQS